MSRVLVWAPLVLVVIGVAGWMGGDRAAVRAAEATCVLTILLLALAVPGLGRRRRLEPDGGSERSARFPSYDRAYSVVLLARSSARHVDLGLRPLLRRIVAARLADLGPAAVRAAVGEQVWALIDPDRAACEDSRLPGLDNRTLSRVLDRLEAL